MNYFTLFKLPQIFNIDIKLLTKKFYALQRKFHPDKLYCYPDLTKKNMLKDSMLINKGYRILKDSLHRAEYLLLLNGYDLKDKKHMLYDNNFLIDQFNFYEEMEKIKKLPLDIISINNFLIRIKKIQDNYNHQLIELLTNKNWDQALRVLYKVLFFNKLKLRVEKLQ